MTMIQANITSIRSRSSRVGLPIAVACMTALGTLQAQQVFFEDFEGLALGPNQEEALAGAQVWTQTPPTG